MPDQPRAQALFSGIADARRRLRCIPRMLTAQNARLGSPLDRDELNDVTQDALIIIWRKLGEYEELTSFESWGYRICFLELMNHIRKKRRRTRMISEAAAQKEEDERWNRNQGPSRFVDLHAGLGTLEPEEATILRLHHFDNLNFPAVGKQLGLPLGTVKTRYYRGLRKLKGFLENHEGGMRNERTHA